VRPGPYLQASEVYGRPEEALRAQAAIKCSFAGKPLDTPPTYGHYVMHFMVLLLVGLEAS